MEFIEKIILPGQTIGFVADAQPWDYIFFGKNLSRKVVQVPPHEFDSFTAVRHKVIVKGGEQRVMDEFGLDYLFLQAEENDIHSDFEPTFLTNNRYSGKFLKVISNDHWRNVIDSFLEVEMEKRLEQGIKIFGKSANINLPMQLLMEKANGLALKEPDRTKILKAAHSDWPFVIDADPSKKVWRVLTPITKNGLVVGGQTTGEPKKLYIKSGSGSVLKEVKVLSSGAFQHQIYYEDLNTLGTNIVVFQLEIADHTNSTAITELKINVDADVIPLIPIGTGFGLNYEGFYPLEGQSPGWHWTNGNAEVNFIFPPTEGKTVYLSIKCFRPRNPQSVAFEINGIKLEEFEFSKDKEQTIELLIPKEYFLVNDIQKLVIKDKSSTSTRSGKRKLGLRISEIKIISMSSEKK